MSNSRKPRVDRRGFLKGAAAGAAAIVSLATACPAAATAGCQNCTGDRNHRSCSRGKTH